MNSQRRLLNQTRNSEVASHVEIADSFWSRSRGLLGRDSLAQGHTLWIQGTRMVACNSIHTWFMRFAIDAVFVDRDLCVRKLYRDLGPWRVTAPAVGAFSVFELPAGTLAKQTIEVGDQLYVGD